MMFASAYCSGNLSLGNGGVWGREGSWEDRRADVEVRGNGT